MVAALQLVEFADQFDGARVVVTGQVQEVRPSSSAQPDAYTVFVLADSTARATVFSRNLVPIARDDVVEVRGTFRHVAHVGSQTFNDMVEASGVRRLSPAAPVPEHPS